MLTVPMIRPGTPPVLVQMPDPRRDSSGDDTLGYDPETMDVDLLEGLRDYRAKLETYGTADDLAVHLQTCGVKAVRGAADRCAIAEHARDVLDLDDDIRIMVTGAGITLQRTREVELPGGVGPNAVPLRWWERTVVAAARHPDMVSEFVVSFDANRYPELTRPLTDDEAAED